MFTYVEMPIIGMCSGRVEVCLDSHKSSLHKASLQQAHKCPWTLGGQKHVCTRYNKCFMGDKLPTTAVSNSAGSCARLVGQSSL